MQRSRPSIIPFVSIFTLLAVFLFASPLMAHEKRARHRQAEQPRVETKTTTTTTTTNRRGQKTTTTTVEKTTQVKQARKPKRVASRHGKVKKRAPKAQRVVVVKTTRTPVGQKRIVRR